MSITGAINQIVRERDKPYIYMPNPSLIHPRTVKITHYLKIVDFYITYGCPDMFVPEPVLGEYLPDVYMRDGNNVPYCVEIQLTPISHAKMQKKIDSFVKTYKQKLHDAKTFLLVTDNRYDRLEIPSEFTIERMTVPKEVYT